MGGDSSHSRSGTHSAATFCAWRCSVLHAQTWSSQHSRGCFTAAGSHASSGWTTVPHSHARRRRRGSASYRPGGRRSASAFRSADQHTLRTTGRTRECISTSPTNWRLIQRTVSRSSSVPPQNGGPNSMRYGHTKRSLCRRRHSSTFARHGVTQEFTHLATPSATVCAA